MAENKNRDTDWFQAQERICPVYTGTTWDMVDVVVEGEASMPQSGFHSVQETARWQPTPRWQPMKSGFELPEQRLRARCTHCDTFLFIPLRSTSVGEG